MADHDPLCPVADDPARRDHCAVCTVIAMVRADERERMQREFADSPWQEHAARIQEAERERITAAIEAMDDDGIHVFLKPGVSTTHVGVFYPDGSAFVPDSDVTAEEMHLAFALDRCWPLVRKVDAARIARQGGG